MHCTHYVICSVFPNICGNAHQHADRRGDDKNTDCDKETLSSVADDDFGVSMPTSQKAPRGE